MRTTVYCAVFGVMVLVAAAGALALDKKTVEVPAEGAKRLDVQLEFGAGELYINPDAVKNVAVFDITYDRRSVDYAVDYDVEGGTGHLVAESEHRENHDFDTEENEWRVSLSREYPLTLDMSIGACDAEIDLGGLQLEELSMEVGAASAEITFSEPNPIEMEELRFEAGASSLTATDIGNANFRFCTFEGGAGSFDLDFRGEYTGESEIRIEIGMGSADIILPKGIPCRIEGTEEGFLSSVDIHGGEVDKVSDDAWESPDFDSATKRIVLQLEVGVGSIDVRFR